MREKPAPPPRWHLRGPHCAQFAPVVVGRLMPAMSLVERPAHAPP